ncbi:LamG domain-containing protein [Gimesia chilikensis]|uniref:LamG-like jellyroll fold domain-containing protein n=1 Tax=Gimesia chilikensis TaxID=2605989 RepID=UPI0011EBF4CD|nr:LamG-like jellyroll fold domain-containing protein [Gimesia chilikensis]KAA0140032.1 LamG domain-containing protein [Gimesia chilikensis]
MMRAKWYWSLLLISVLSCDVPLDVHAEDALIGNWRLEGDARDQSSFQNHAVNHGVKLKAGQPAVFDGGTAYLEVPDSKSLSLGTGDFSLALTVNTSADLGDVIGTLCSKYDRKTRRGFQLSIKNNAGVTSSQSNWHHLQFGIDNGKVDSQWTDHGQLGNAILIYSMAVHDGKLYAGTCVPGAEAAGHVYQYEDGKKWIDCGTPDKCNAVSSLAVYQGHLYAGTGKYRLKGSSLAESENPNMGGNVYRYLGDGTWKHCGNLPGVEAINGMVVYKGKLYASSMYAPAAFYRYDGGTTWTACDVPDGKRVESMAIYNGDLFATGYDEGAVYRYDGKKWTHAGQVGEATQTYGFAVYEGNLYVSEWPHAEVYRYAGEKRWELAGRLGEEKESMPLVVYNGAMYSGSLPLAEVYRYDGGVDWKNLGQIDMTPDVRYRRVWSMAVYQGRLFAGTLPAGRVKSIEAGKSATYDTALKPGWRQIVAVKQKSQLKLYVDGALVATSTSFDPAEYDLSNTEPLKIGFGAHDYYHGKMKDVQLFKRALSAEEVQTRFQQQAD